MSNPKHAKVTKTEPQEDGSVKITQESYYEDLSFAQTEMEKRQFTSRGTILRDVISCIDLITHENSPEVNIQIKSKRGEPEIIIKRWVVERKHYGRR